jgi:segregation and condensation protein A
MAHSDTRQADTPQADVQQEKPVKHGADYVAEQAVETATTMKKSSGQMVTKEPAKKEPDKKKQIAAQVISQSEMPFALVQGEPLTVVPQDLYIPPDALEVILEAFEGPLDLLLYLIKRQNLDILEIPLEETTRQYMSYIEMMQNLKIELAAEYLLMAAMLAEIKSRMLLPRQVQNEDEEDPRAELIRRLQEYERFKNAAQNIDEMPRVSREIYLTDIEPPELHQDRPVPEVDLRDLLLAFKDAMARADMYSHHHIQREALSVRERMSRVLSAISTDGFTSYTSLFTIEEGRRGVVVTLLAILELVKEQLIELVQADTFAPIHLKAIG